MAAKIVTPIAAKIYVIGMGLEGPAGLSTKAVEAIGTAQALIGSERLLQPFPDHPNSQHLGDLSEAIARCKAFLADASPQSHLALLTSGDPLFFGLGRLLLEQLPAESLQFYPHLSSIQLAFSAIKQPWQEAVLVSVHGRSLDTLAANLRRCPQKIAILTDSLHSPSAIAQLLLGLALPIRYRCYVCENLGGASDSEAPERITVGWAEEFIAREFSLLTVVILIQAEDESPFKLIELPLLGLPDDAFATFSDRPSLMTKREVRIFALAELALGPHQVIWDIGAGTGSVSIEVARLQPTAKIFSVEKTAAGQGLIGQNRERFSTPNVQVIAGSAPDCLKNLPAPDRVFIGGSGRQLPEILAVCAERLKRNGRLVLAIATLENFAIAQAWFRQRSWSMQLMQAQFSRGVAIASPAISASSSQTRWAPLNPIQIITAQLPQPPTPAVL